MATTVFDLQAVLGLDMSGFESGLNKAKSFASGISSGIGTAMKVGVAAVSTATTALVGLGATSVKTGAEFDKSMAQVAATMGKTMAEMENEVGQTTVTLNGEVKNFSGTLREFAQFMGQNTAFSASQAADALNYMALAGYKTQESMEMLPNVLNLAAAGNFDLARASDMVTDTQTAFGISFERTNQLVDEMAKAASTGNTSVEQLGDAFLVVGGLARELNGGFVTLADGTKAPVDGIQEMEIAMTAMANAGVKGSEAGTHMRNMILKLSNPTDKGTKALERMGLKIYDTDGKMRSLVNIFGDLNTKLSTMTQEEKIQTISALFNTRDLASAEALLNAVGQDWDKIGASILDAKDAASQMAATQLDNLAGDITLFKSALEGAQIAISDVLTPSLREFVQFGTKGLSELTEAFQTKGLTGAMEKFGELLSEGLNMLIDMLPEFVEGGIQLIGALGKGIIDNLPAIMDAGTEIISMLAKAFADGLPELIKAGSQIISDMLQAISDNLPTITPLIIEFIVGIAKIITDNIDQFIDVAIEIASAIGEGLIEAAPIIADKAPEIISKLVEAFKEHPEALVVVGPTLISHMISGIGAAMPLLKEALKTAIFDIGPSLSGALSSVGTFFTTSLSELFSSGAVAAIGTTATAVVGGIAAFFGGAEIGKKFGAAIFPEDADLYEHYSGITGTLELVRDTVVTMGERIGEHWDSFKTTASEKWNGIKETISGAVGTFKTDAEEKLTAFKTSVSTKWDETKQNASEKWEGIKQTVSNAWESFTQNPVVDTVIDYFKSTFENVKETISGIWEGIKTNFEGVWEVIKNIFAGHLLIILDLVTGNFTQLKSDIANIWDNIKEGAKKVWDGIQQTITSITEGIKEQVRIKFDTMKNLVSTIVDNLKAFLQNAWNNIKTTAVNAWNILKTNVVNIATNLKNSAVQTITNLVNSIPAIWNNLQNMARSAWDNFKTLIVNTIESTISSVRSALPRLVSLIREKFDEAVSYIKELPQRAWDWGRDLVSEFGDGIMDKMYDLRRRVSDMAETIRGYLHFSSPDVGPLRDFPSYAPDMIDLFIQGIKDNTRDLQNQVAKAFDFGNFIVQPSMGDFNLNGVERARENVNITMNIYGSDGQDIKELADYVSDRLMLQLAQTGAVYA